MNKLIKKSNSFVVYHLDLFARLLLFFNPIIFGITSKVLTSGPNTSVLKFYLSLDGFYLKWQTLAGRTFSTRTLNIQIFLQNFVTFNRIHVNIINPYTVIQSKQKSKLYHLDNFITFISTFITCISNHQVIYS